MKYRFFLILTSLFLAACGREDHVVLAAKKFDKGSYEAMVDLIFKIQARAEMQEVDDQASVEDVWYGLRIDNVCLITLDEALRYYENRNDNAILLAPLSENGTYATFLSGTHHSGRVDIKISNIHNTSSDGTEELEYVHDFDTPVSVIYKSCSNDRVG